MAFSPETALHRGFPIYPAQAADGVPPDAKTIETKAVAGKSAEAVELVEREAGEKGWQLLARQRGRRGGGALFFGKRKGDDRADLVHAYLNAGAIAIVAGKRLESGTWRYVFEETTPVIVDGFPLCHRPIGELSRKGRSSVVGCAGGAAIEDELRSLPGLFGWKTVSEGPGNAVYERSGKRVRVEDTFSARGRTRSAMLVSDGVE